MTSDDHEHPGGELENHEDLLAAMQAQSRFIAAASHDMRSPLHAILGLVELVLDSEELSMPATRQLHSISREGQSMRRMLDDLLDFSRFTAGGLELAHRPFSPAKLADEVSTHQRLNAEEKGLSYVLRVAPEVPLAVLGDPERLRRVLINLVSNAIKYTSTGGVTVELASTPSGAISFSVADTGRGIPPAALGSLFDPYIQTQSEDSSVGAGLGLAIVKKLVELMNGRIEVESSEAGSRFSCEIPFDQARRSNDVLVADDAPPMGQGRVLVVDDSEVNRMLAAAQLQRLGFDVATASSGPEALDLLDGEMFAAVLMDWHMPGMDGLETTRIARTRSGHPADVPIIAMTASAMSGDRDRCIEAGMNDYLPKPVSVRDLGLMLQRWTATSPEESVPERRGKLAVNRSTIDGLLEDLGDPAVVASVIDTFLGELPRWRAELVDGVAQHDFDAAGRAAHTLKSTAALLGADGLAATCTDFEGLARTNPAKAAALVDEFRERADETELELRQLAISIHAA